MLLCIRGFCCRIAVFKFRIKVCENSLYILSGVTIFSLIPKQEHADVWPFELNKWEHPIGLCAQSTFCVLCITFKATVLQFFLHSQIGFALMVTDVKRETTSPEIGSVSRQEVIRVRGWPIPCFRLSGTDCVWCTHSDPRKRSETLVSMNRLTPLHPHLTYLWWCISGISCSLSEWVDWIDMFSVHDPFHTRGTNLRSQTEKPFRVLVPYFAVNVFTDHSLRSSSQKCTVAEVSLSELGPGQAPFRRTLLSEKVFEFHLL